MQRFALFAGSSTAALGALMLPAIAVAQTTPDTTPQTDQTATAQAPTPRTVAATTEEDPGDIIITGSRIARPAVDNPQPTTTVDAATINNRGYPDIARALNELPGFGVPDSSLVGDQGNGFGVGQSFVNLYGLGSQRTLTLVNARRFVGANPATIFSSGGAGTQVDLNTIPTKLIQRIETISIGGAPIYGADAIAGTVNIILRNDYEGLDVDGQVGISQRGDLGNQRVRLLAGKNFADGRGNITVNVEYNHDDGLLGNKREIIRRQLGFIAPAPGTSPFNQILVENTRTYLGTPAGIPFIRDAARLVPATAAARRPLSAMRRARSWVSIATAIWCRSTSELRRRTPPRFWAVTT